MGLFRKKKDFVDYTERRKVKNSVNENISPDSGNSGAFGIFEAMNQESSPFQEYPSSESNHFSGNGEFIDAEEKRKKLAKRLSEMTDKIEESSNQIYHLQQRVELLEKKININRGLNEE